MRKRPFQRMSTNGYHSYKGGKPGAKRSILKKDSQSSKVSANAMSPDIVKLPRAHKKIKITAIVVVR